MVIPEFAAIGSPDSIIADVFGDSQCCCGGPAEIVMHGYAENRRDLSICRRCALQLARKLIEDLCALDGDRHG